MPCYVAPTLVTACTALPPEGVAPCLGRPGAAAAPTLVTARTALPRQGAVPCLGRPGAAVAPTLVTACTALPPEGLVSCLGRPGAAEAPMLVTACTARGQPMLTWRSLYPLHSRLDAPAVRAGRVRNLPGRPRCGRPSDPARCKPRPREWRLPARRPS